jgi:molecular chaperone GrpE
MRSDRNEVGDTRNDPEAAAEAGSDATGQQSAGTAAPGAAPESGEAPGEEQPAEAGALRRELDELRDRHLRLVAEFDNYRKRTERERTESWVKAQGQLVERLLEAVDDLERVADYTEESTTVTALLEGVQMVERKLLRALETAGLERLESHGAPFNPQEHEALMTSTTEHPHEDETVGEVFQKGYRFQGHLLRPARVQVRKHEG